MKKFTTSAQMTLTITKDSILDKLEEELSRHYKLRFYNTNNKDIKQADLEDGSKLVIATFNKDNGKTVAMIDFKGLPVSKNRLEVQEDLKQVLRSVF